ncbi:SHOCT domain-containing protein [Streptacidiphilus neutrinimicus]|uniref:SHOCT domain-containing protein n=1 Tax=Streptacidiphilus neutrinimicus TaxID=105420 RepID=UPI0005A8D52A|nr:SHOCT domain-containing protein [Streptacidiphilus neutrinimicus]
MPGLIRGVARTAAIAGTATAVSNRVSRRQAGRWAEQEQREYMASAQADYPPPQAAPAAPAAPAPGGDMDSKLAQLQQLGALKDQGVLTDAEFAAQKARILGS